MTPDPDPSGPTPPPEANLIRVARMARGWSPEAAAARAPIRLGGGRWRQVESGRKGREAVQAPHQTLAHMAHVVGVTPEQLQDAGRGIAADILREIQRQEQEAAPTPYADLGDRFERAIWEIDLPESDRRQLIDLYRKGRRMQQEEVRHRRPA